MTHASFHWRQHSTGYTTSLVDLDQTPLASTSVAPCHANEHDSWRVR